jgi:hypothetical protein
MGIERDVHWLEAYLVEVVRTANGLAHGSSTNCARGTSWEGRRGSAGSPGWPGSWLAVLQSVLRSRNTVGRSGTAIWLQVPKRPIALNTEIAKSGVNSRAAAIAVSRIRSERLQ